MAKNTKTNRTGRRVVSIIALLLGVLAIAYFTLSLVFGSWNVVNWGKKAPGQIDTGAPGGLITSDGESNGIKLARARIASADYANYGISEQAESAYTITAEITPAGSAVTDITYSIDWTDASSSWAAGKNVADYVTLVQSTTNKLEATVTNLQAFGEQITVKCVYDFDESIYGNCTLDYVKRVESMQVNGFDSTKFGSGDSMTISLTPTYGTGTLTGTVTMTSAHAKFNATAYSYTQGTKYYMTFEQKTNTYLHFRQTTEFKSSLSTFNASTGVISSLMVDEFIEMNAGSDGNSVYNENSPYLFASLYELAQKSGQKNVLALDVNYSYSYGSNFTSTGTATTAYGAISADVFLTDLNNITNITIGPNIIW